MDSNDMGDLLLMMLMDDDLFFIEIEEKEQEQNDVDRIQPESFSKARR